MSKKLRRIWRPLRPPNPVLDQALSDIDKNFDDLGRGGGSISLQTVEGGTGSYILTGTLAQAFALPPVTLSGPSAVILTASFRVDDSSTTVTSVIYELRSDPAIADTQPRVVELESAGAGHLDRRTVEYVRTLTATGTVTPCLFARRSGPTPTAIGPIWMRALVLS